MIQLSVKLNSVDQREQLEGFLYENPDDPWVLTVLPEGATILEGYFQGSIEGERALKKVTAAIGALGNSTETILADEDWQGAYRHHLQVRRFGPLIWIPLWERDSVSLQPGEAAVYLDSGMAFGTGAHETTRLCARQLVRYDGAHAVQREAAVVLDAGCGSGILGLSAARLGYSGVRGFDFDPEAVRISRENAEINDLGTTVDFFVAGIEEGLRGASVDLLLANIETPILRQYAKNLLRAIKPGGWLVMSGILEKDGDPLIREYADTAAHCWPGGYELESEVEGEWISVTLRRG